MVASDTVVGIVGATILVAVMVGVFVYEYNNTDTEPAPDPDDFDETYPFLDGAGDLDGDGTPNAQDPDMDGDGIPNREDTDIVFHASFSGTVDPSAPPASRTGYLRPIPTETGATRIEVQVTYDVALPAPAPRSPNFQVTLTDADGTAVGESETTMEGSTVTTAIILQGDVQAGQEYLLTVSEPQGGIGGSFEGMAMVTYTP